MPSTNCIKLRFIEHSTQPQQYTHSFQYTWNIHKTNLKRIEIVQYMFSDHNGIKLESNTKR